MEESSEKADKYGNELISDWKGKVMEKKKVIIVMPSLYLGGAERSLIGLLESFDYDNYEVSLFLYRQEGELLGDIPDKVNILPEIDAYRTFDVPVSSLVRKGKLSYLRSRVAAKIRSWMFCSFHRQPMDVWLQLQNISRSLQPKLPDIPGKYDLGIMFSGFPDTLVNKVNAKVKMAWFHTDYDQVVPDPEYDLKTYRKIDWIVGVSDLCTEKIRRRYPSISNKVITIENILGEVSIRKNAVQDVSDMEAAEDEISLLSIGRFCAAKNFDNVPEINSILHQLGWKTKWFLIGYGSDESLVKEKIAQWKMEDSVILLGKKNNPYPYIKRADYYIQPSRYEGKCVAVREAQILGIPVIITDYESSKDQLRDGIDGCIVPMDNQACAEGISQILSNSSLRNRLISNCLKEDFKNKDEIEKIYSRIAD